MKGLFFQLLICGLALVISMPSALAQDTSAREEMLRLSEQGQQHFQDGRLEEAIEVYQRAYEAYPQPVLLKNQMIALYLLEDCAAAIELGEVFIAAGTPSEEDQMDVEAVFGECSVDLAESELREEQWTSALEWIAFGEDYFIDEPLREDAESVRERAQKGLEDAENDASTDDGVAGSGDTGNAGADAGGGPNILGWSLTGGGVAMLAGATVWYFQGQSMFRELDQAANSEDVSLQEFNALDEELTPKINRARVGVPVLYAVGGLVTAAGVVFLFLPSSDEDDSLATFTPVVGPEMTGASFSLRF